MILNNMSSYVDDNIIGGNTTDKCLLNFFKPCGFDYIKKIKTVPFKVAMPPIIMRLMILRRPTQNISVMWA